MLQYVPLGEFKVSYLDGESEVVRSNFGSIMELEGEYAKTPDDEIRQGTMLVKAMWLYLGRPKDSLEAWAGNVHTIEPQPNGTKTDPTPPAAGDG